MGAVPVLARGLGYTAPTYVSRRPGSQSNGLLGSALLFKPLQVNTSEAKARLRRQALDRRAALDPSARVAFSARLKTEGLALALRYDANAVSAFHPIRDEPDTLAFLDSLAQRGLVTALPITGGRDEALTFRVWRPGDPTVPGQLRIPEPDRRAPLVEPDLLFVPLAAFDRRGHRIGYGAGHYDRTLAMLRSRRRTIAVGIAYSVCELEAIPAEPHDEALDYILTETELVKATR
jgi:5-formyltetrahydrofolate cyclo-ligase